MLPGRTASTRQASVPAGGRSADSVARVSRATRRAPSRSAVCGSAPTAGTAAQGSRVPSVSMSRNRSGCSVCAERTRPQNRGGGRVGLLAGADGDGVAGDDREPGVAEAVVGEPVPEQVQHLGGGPVGGGDRVGSGGDGSEDEVDRAGVDPGEGWRSGARGEAGRVGAEDGAAGGGRGLGPGGLPRPAEQRVAGAGGGHRAQLPGRRRPQSQPGQLTTGRPSRSVAVRRSVSALSRTARTPGRGPCRGGRSHRCQETGSSRGASSGSAAGTAWVTASSSAGCTRWPVVSTVSGSATSAKISRCPGATGRAGPRKAGP